MLGRYKVPRTTQNHPAWDGAKKGHYEVWYLTLNAPEANAAFWLRYTLDAPDHGEPYGELWGNFFDAAHAEHTFGLRQRFERKDFAVDQSPLIRLGADNALHEGHARGRLEDAEHSLEWDLRFTPSPTAFFIAPVWLRSFLANKRTNWGVPHMDVRFEGRIVADGREFHLENAPGQQAHLFGRQHALRWAWAHCNAFDGGKDALMEGVGVEMVLGGKPRFLTLLYFRYGGRDFFANALPGPALTGQSTLDFPVWRFETRVDGTTFRGAVTSRPEQLLQVRYEDPDGTQSYCCNSEVSDLRVEVVRGGQVVDVLTASGTAHLEFGQRQKREGIRMGAGS